MAIDSNEVSVVIQGPVGPAAVETVASVRRFLPGAQLILSTWRGSATDGLAVDEVILSDDPGSVPYPEPNGTASPRMANTNRMLRSSRAGLERAERTYALKLRTDSPLTGTGFLSWWGRFERRRDSLKVFQSRVVTTSVATRPGLTMSGYLFHPSDCAHFGLKADVLHLWSAREIDEAANFTFRPDPSLPARTRFWNEQVLWLDCLERSGMAVDYPWTGYAGAGVVDRSDLSIANNFTVIEPWQFGISFPTLRAMTEGSAMESYMWFPYWLDLYRGLTEPATA